MTIYATIPLTTSVGGTQKEVVGMKQEGRQKTLIYHGVVVRVVSRNIQYLKSDNILMYAPHICAGAGEGGRIPPLSILLVYAAASTSSACRQAACARVSDSHTLYPDSIKPDSEVASQLQ